MKQTDPTEPSPNPPESETVPEKNQNPPKEIKTKKTASKKAKAKSKTKTKSTSKTKNKTKTKSKTPGKSNSAEENGLARGKKSESPLSKNATEKSGKKSGLRDLARHHTELALDTLAEVAIGGSDEKMRLAAAEALLDRGWGKPSPNGRDEEAKPQNLAPMVVKVDTGIVRNRPLKKSATTKSARLKKPLVKSSWAKTPEVNSPAESSQYPDQDNSDHVIAREDENDAQP